MPARTRLTRFRTPPKGALPLAGSDCPGPSFSKKGDPLSDDNGPNETPPAREPVGDDARINALEERLKAAREREEERTKPTGGAEADANYRLGNRVLAELIGGIGGGAFIGWVIDLIVGNGKHWGLLVVMALGIVVSFRNIIRISSRRPD